MPKLSPSEARAKHATRLKGATADIRAGVERVKTAPGLQAAAKTEKMRANLMAALDSGKWAQRVGSVSLEDWKRLMSDKGIQRIAAGIDGAAEKMEEFYAQLFPFQENLQSKIGKLPDLTLEDNITRMTEFVRGMSQFKRK